MNARIGLVVVAALLLAPAAASAATEKRLDAQLKDLAAYLKASIQNDPKIKGRAVTLGLFNGPKLRGSNFGTRIERALAAELAGLVADKAELTILGRYDYRESETDFAGDDLKFKLRVLLITAVIEDAAGKQLDVKSVEVNDSDDIFAVLGLTGQPPFNGGQKKRNEAPKKAFDNPTFFVREKTRVSDAKDSPYAVEVLVKEKADGVGMPVKPDNKKGLAFVDIKPTQFYELRIYNDKKYEAAVTITIDGLDALNTFNIDKVKYQSYIIPPKSSVLVRGWLHTTKPRPVERDNVLSFLVTEYGHGAATKFKSTGAVGVITVQFAYAWKEGGPVPPNGTREVGRETTEGPGLPEKLEVVKRHVGDRRSTISIRYSP